MSGTTIRTSGGPSRPAREQTRLLTSQEAARFLRIPLNTLYQLRSKGTAPLAVRIGRRVQYRLADLEAYVEENLDDGSYA
jgi:excisionase family DNA binding protein